MISNAKLSPQLQLIFSLSKAELSSNFYLGSSYDSTTNLWQFIVIHNNFSKEEARSVPCEFIPLYGSFGIISIETPYIENLLLHPRILYMEPSGLLFQEQFSSKKLIDRQLNSLSFPVNFFSGLTGKGTAIAVIDSGVDYRHLDFRNADGSTRILTYWDQTISVVSPNNPYGFGYIFSQEELNSFLLSQSSFSATVPFYNPNLNPSENTLSADTAFPSIQPSDDFSGHGTHVAGICAGNGRASNGRYQGVAPETSLIVIKLKGKTNSLTTNNAHLMMGIDYAISFANENQLPLSLNLSYGTNNGAHNGASLLERFLGQSIFYGKNITCVATGNEGLTKRHTSFSLLPKQSTDLRFQIGPNESALYLQLFFQLPALSGTFEASNRFLASADTSILSQNPFLVSLYPPGQTTPVLVFSAYGIYQQKLSSYSADLLFAKPTPYQPESQIYLALTGNQTTFTSRTLTGNQDLVGPKALPSGLWTLTFRSYLASTISFQAWLPEAEGTNPLTAFEAPSDFGTLTIPSTAENIISVGGYNAITDTFAPFSGRGFLQSAFRTQINTSARPFNPSAVIPSTNIIASAPGNRSNAYLSTIQPTLCAPAVDIISTAPNGGYTAKTGTSMAAPYITGLCSLLMEYGIVQENDPYLYGEALKQLLVSNARSLPSFLTYPNPYIGWGVY